MPVSKEIAASLEQFRLARGRRQLGNRLQDILARQAKRQEGRTEAGVSVPSGLAGNKLEEPTPSPLHDGAGSAGGAGGLLKQLVTVSQSGAGVQAGLALGGIHQLVLGQDQGGAVAQLQALSLDENRQARVNQRLEPGGDVNLGAGHHSAPQPQPTSQSSLSWAEALGQVDQRVWDGSGLETTSLFQELSTLQ